MTTKTMNKPRDAAPRLAAAQTLPSMPRSDSKIGKVVALLERKQGATLDELVKATGWQTHTARAALTGLKKRGFEIARTRREDASAYAIVAKS